MKKAEMEYKKYQAETLSTAEKDYLEGIKGLEKTLRQAQYKKVKKKTSLSKKK